MNGILVWPYGAIYHDSLDCVISNNYIRYLENANGPASLGIETSGINIAGGTEIIIKDNIIGWYTLGIWMNTDKCFDINFIGAVAHMKTGSMTVTNNVFFWNQCLVRVEYSYIFNISNNVSWNDWSWGGTTNYCPIEIVTCFDYTVSNNMITYSGALFAILLLEEGSFKRSGYSQRSYGADKTIYSLEAPNGTTLSIGSVGLSGSVSNNIIKVHNGGPELISVFHIVVGVLSFSKRKWAVAISGNFGTHDTIDNAGADYTYYDTGNNILGNVYIDDPTLVINMGGTWTPFGSNIYFGTGSQYVGINNSYPGASLDVIGAGTAGSQAMAGRFRRDSTAVSPAIMLVNYDKTALNGTGILFRAVSSSDASFNGASLTAIVTDRTPNAEKMDMLISTGGDNSNGNVNTERFRITSAGRIGINNSSPVNTLHLSGLSTDNYTSFLRIDGNYTGNWPSPGINVYRARGNSNTSLTTVVDGDYVRYDGVYVHDGTSFQSRAYSGAQVVGTVSTGSVPTDYIIGTGSSSASEKFRVVSDGRLRLSNQPTPPATATSTGTAGDVIFDFTNGYIYCCVATNSWKRATLATW